MTESARHVHPERSGPPGSRGKIWIIGGGRFGRRAAEILSGRHSPEDLLLVDRDPAALTGAGPPGLPTLCRDGVEFLAGNLVPGKRPEWIVPCLPLHLAFEWLCSRLGRAALIMAVPPGIARRLPHPRPGGRGGYCLSYADFICPDDCPEPADTCTYTGRPRPGTLYADLAREDWPGFGLIVIRSRQLAPGLGGYRPGDLFEMERKVRASTGPVLIVTACKCHGVINALRTTGK